MRLMNQCGGGECNERDTGHAKPAGRSKRRTGERGADYPADEE